MYVCDLRMTISGKYILILFHWYIRLQRVHSAVCAKKSRNPSHEFQANGTRFSELFSQQTMTFYIAHTGNSTSERETIFLKRE
jgi:hypothetical protein